MFGRGRNKEECPELPLKPKVSSKNELCIVALGGPQLRFQQVKGVARVVVGYSGGHELNPTYRTIKDHTEAVLIEFDPEIISYEDLLVEYSRHNYPYSKSKTQYRSAIWYLNEEQETIALDTLKSIEAGAQGQKVYLDVEPVTRFYRAEEYHQNFLSKRQR